FSFVDYFLLSMTMAFANIRAVSHFVQYRLGVSPQPRQWPEDPAKAKRQKAYALNGLGLRVPFLLGNLFRQAMHHPESHDSNDCREDQHDPGDAIGDCVERLAVKKRGVRTSGQRKEGKCDQRSEPPAVTAPGLRDGLDVYVFCFTLH